uniref:RRM domain-containing protein n=2 Tax=Phaseolus vulgaris TaxID=3885 RepID=V7AKU1_PHAVU|nr:hypothetical protein PHAVU_011G184000g [Phaseolus vulgaris]ESW05493.1 hypothetical protein PHAVU_011G184000g [Phaseolus vulgaris]
MQSNITMRICQPNLETKETPESHSLLVHLPGYAEDDIGAQFEYDYRRVRVFDGRSLGDNKSIRFNIVYTVDDPILLSMKVSFFFSNFPHDYDERDMWKIFQRWGRIKDIFISRRLNIKRQRFEFVRFHEVVEEDELERRLNAIWIGTWKLRVNKSKYRKVTGTTKERNEDLNGLKAPQQRQERTVSHRAHTHPPTGFNNTRTYAQVVTMDRRQPFLQAGLMGNEKAKGHTELNMAHINVEKEDVEWLRNNFDGKLSDAGMVQVVKESFIMEGVDFIRVRYLGGQYVLLSGESDGIIQKTLKDNKEMMGALFESIVPWEESFAVDEKVVWVRCRGLPLSMWNRGCFERVAAHVGSLVEVDEAMSEFEDLEFARLRVRAPVGRAIRMAMDMKINDILCQIVLEEEIPLFNTCGCCSHGRGGEARGGDSDEGSEEKFGEELLESEGSDADVQQYERRKGDEECSVKFPVEDAVGEEGGASTGSPSKVLGSRTESRLPFLEEHVGCSWKASADRAHSKHAPVQKEDGTSKGLSTASRSGNVFDLIVNGPAKAQLHEGSEFSIFVGLGSKQMEVEQTGGVPIARNAKSGVDGAVEDWASDAYDEKSDDNPRDGINRSLSRVEASGEDVVGEVTITEEDDGRGSYTPKMRRPERLSEPSQISSPIQAYHIRTRARAKAIATCARSGDATTMAKKVDDKTKMVKVSGGRKSDTINEGRVRLSSVGGRRGTLEDNFFKRMLCPVGRILGSFLKALVTCQMVLLGIATGCIGSTMSTRKR